MKKFKFAFLAAFTAIFTLVFSEPQAKPSLSTVYAFDSNGNFLGSGEYATLDAQICPGDDVFCAQVWTGITSEERPAGEELQPMKKQAPQK